MHTDRDISDATIVRQRAFRTLPGYVSRPR
jgi:hypothetical protein